MALFFPQIVQKCCERKKKKKILIHRAKFLNIIWAQWPTGLGFQTSARAVLHQICSSLCLIKFKTLAVDADAVGQFSRNAATSLVNRASVSYLAGLRVFGEKHTRTIL